MEGPAPRRWRFEVRLVMQTACPSKFAWLEGVASDGTGVLSGAEGLLEELRELGALDKMSELAAGHEIDVKLSRAVVHPVDSHPRDFVGALLAVARAIRGIDGAVSYVRTLVVEPISVE